ncbi:MAG: magnesium chelatase, partial [Chloroflexi bacterium]|nr:magnesium chelatase [Chloroflexota bacterium]
MTATGKATTLKDLKDSGYRVIGVREELRRNLVRKIVNEEELFPGIIGYEESVIPQVENANLAGQDNNILGERWQAKSRLN